MVIEINAAIQSVLALSRMVQVGYEVRNANEINAAVAETFSKLTTAWSAALEAQEKQATLAKRVGELEKEIAELKNWDREAERYELCSIIMGFSTYRLKPGVEQGEPTHYLCAHCYSERKKSILQFSIPAGYSCHAECPRCMNKFMLDATDIAHHFPTFYEKQRP